MHTHWWSVIYLVEEHNAISMKLRRISSNPNQKHRLLSVNREKESKDWEEGILYHSFLSLWKKDSKLSLVYPPCVTDQLLHCKIANQTQCFLLSHDGLQWQLCASETPAAVMEHPVPLAIPATLADRKTRIPQQQKMSHSWEKNTSNDVKECSVFFGFTYNWNLEEEDEFSLLFSQLTPQHNKASASKITGKWLRMWI